MLIHFSKQIFNQVEYFGKFYLVFENNMNLHMEYPFALLKTISTTLHYSTFDRVKQHTGCWKPFLVQKDFLKRDTEYIVTILEKISNDTSLVKIYPVKLFKKIYLSQSDSPDYITFLHNCIAEKRRVICCTLKYSLKKYLPVKISSKFIQQNSYHKRPEQKSHLQSI